jgi:imidazolonepropionase-like amidohydrolase
LAHCRCSHGERAVARHGDSLRLLINLVAATLPLALACWATEPLSPVRPTDPASTKGSVALAFIDVSILPMTSATRLDHRSVHVRNGSIEWIGAVGEKETPADATVIQGDGRVLMPALMDMHVHIMKADLRAYVSHGIGTVRNMWGHATVRSLRDQIAADTLFGPTIITVSPGLDAPPLRHPVTQVVTTAREADSIVAAVKSVGYKELKLYDNLTLAMFDTVIGLSRANAMPAVGHVPFAVSVHHALEQGMRSIEHLTGYDRAVSRQGQVGTGGFIDVDQSRYAALVQATVAAGTWNCPTLAIYDKLADIFHSPQQKPAIVGNRQRLVKALFDAGAKLLIGSDAGAQHPSGEPILSPGSSLHDELSQFVAAGLSPYQALRIATIGGADYFNRPDLGRLEVGARADLILLAADPLQDIRRARLVGGVVLGGGWTPQREFATRTDR